MTDEYDEFMEWADNLDTKKHPPKYRRFHRLRARAAIHELECRECRVTWYSWFLRLTHIGGMSPRATNWRRR